MLTMQHMINAAQEEFFHMLVIERIKDLSALFVCADQVHLAQPTHMMGYC